MREGPGSLSIYNATVIPYRRLLWASVYGAEPRAGDGVLAPLSKLSQVDSVVGEGTRDTIESSYPENLPGANLLDRLPT